MWILLALISAFCLGVYDIFKKTSLVDNNVLVVLGLNTLFSCVIMSPVLVYGFATGREWFGGDYIGYGLMALKSVIVLTSWGLGYIAIKHLPLTVTGSINAARPVVVLFGGLLLFGERLTLLQWVGMILGFISLYLTAAAGARDGFSLRNSKWLWFALASMLVGAISGLYDKFLLKHYDPWEVQAWYTLFQCLIMGTVLLILHRRGTDKTPFHWRWAIIGISVVLTLADLIYYQALSDPDSMISVVSMIRRGSVIVSFVYGALVLREKNLRMKIADLSVLILGLICIVLGSR